MPFLPLYIRELGVVDLGDIALWTGLTLGATPAVTAFSAPLWGRVGDRYGSKVLVLRSLSAFVLTKGAMAFVTAPWQLFALRALLGVFAGYGALTVSMAAESVPREQMARAIGTVQIAQRLGPAIGPVIGGLLAPLVGLRGVVLDCGRVLPDRGLPGCHAVHRAAHAAGADRPPPHARCPWTALPDPGLCDDLPGHPVPAARRSQLRAHPSALRGGARVPGHPGGIRLRRVVLDRSLFRRPGPPRRRAAHASLAAAAS